MALFGETGQRIAYSVFDHSGDAPPLLLLHGFTASSASWLPVIPELRRHFTVITADLLGHGGSDAPESGEAYGPEQAVARLAGLLDELGYTDGVLVCGHSLGGALALRLALDHPERVAGLVIINSNSAAGTEEWRRESQEQLTVMATRVRDEGVGFLKQTRLYPARSNRLPDDARDALTEDFDRLTPAGIAGTAEQLVAQVNASERLGDVAVPALVVVGERDADFVHAAPRLAAGLRKAKVKLVTLADAGHLAQVDTPGPLATEITAFAREIDYLPPLTAAQRYRRPVAVGSGFAIGWLAIGWGAYTLVSSGGGGVNAQPNAPVASTPTPATSVARTPTTAPPPTGTVLVATPTVTTPPAASPSATATAVPATPTPRPTQQGQVLDPTPTRVPATATPAETPVTPTATAVPPTATAGPPTATATPAGRYLSISGPTSAVAGESVTFLPHAGGAPFRIRFSASNGDGGEGSLTTRFDVPACYTVSAVAYYDKPGASITSTTAISVGGVACR